MVRKVPKTGVRKGVRAKLKSRAKATLKAAKRGLKVLQKVVASMGLIKAGLGMIILLAGATRVFAMGVAKWGIRQRSAPTMSGKLKRVQLGLRALGLMGLHLNL